MEKVKPSHRKEEVFYLIHTHTHTHLQQKDLYPEYTSKSDNLSTCSHSLNVYFMKKDYPSYVKWYENGLNFTSYQEMKNEITIQYQYSSIQKIANVK